MTNWSAKILFSPHKCVYPDVLQDYIVLSGGLGSSAYVKSRLKARFEAGTEMPNLQVLVSEEP